MATKQPTHCSPFRSLAGDLAPVPSAAPSPPSVYYYTRRRHPPPAAPAVPPEPPALPPLPPKDALNKLLSGLLGVAAPPPAQAFAGDSAPPPALLPGAWLNGSWLAGMSREAVPPPVAVSNSGDAVAPSPIEAAAAVTPSVVISDSQPSPGPLQPALPVGSAEPAVDVPPQQPAAQPLDAAAQSSGTPSPDVALEPGAWMGRRLVGV